MTSTGRRGIPVLDGVATEVAAAHVAVSSATRSALRRGLAQTFPPPPPPPPPPIFVTQHSWAALFRLTRADLCRVAARAERTPLPDAAPNSLRERARPPADGRRPSTVSHTTRSHLRRSIRSEPVRATPPVPTLAHASDSDRPRPGDGHAQHPQEEQL